MPLKKSFAQKIFGSNLFLKNKKIVSVSIPPYNTLLAARKIFFTDTEKPFQIKEEFSLVPLYQFVLTYFAQNSWSFFSPEGGRQLGEQLDERLGEPGFI